VYQRNIDQYRVKTDKRSGITNDPNRVADPEYIVRLIKQVVTVSVETVKIVFLSEVLSKSVISPSILFLMAIIRLEI
jgi:hypothetical protein